MANTPVVIAVDREKELARGSLDGTVVRGMLAHVGLLDVVGHRR